jgi:hypothetical protein
MKSAFDWSWKLREAVDRVRTRYHHIGRQSGAPFLAVVYPPLAEAAVFKEWRMLTEGLGPEFGLRSIDVLDVTMSVVDELGVDNIISSMNDPMPGSNPETDLCLMWTGAIVSKVKELLTAKCDEKVVVVLERLAALFPVAGPRDLMQQLWDNQECTLNGPVVVLIPGTIIEPKVYSFLDKRREFMYRGDIL